jgi:glycosyltransferase involved in cell wall biosynthesis
LKSPLSAQQPRTLYICYFGLREPLVQTQVIPYLRQIAEDGVDVSLLTFEPQFRASWTRESIRESRAKLAEMKITWYARAYHKRPTLPATVYDILRGGIFAAWLARRKGINILHARGHVPAAMATLAKTLAPVRILFDIRGFMPEEYTDGGMWPPGGLLYRMTKAVERRLFGASDAFVVLTRKASDLLFRGHQETDAKGRPVAVIPCCVDLERFGVRDLPTRNSIRRDLGVEKRTVLVYAGSVGTWYLAQEMVDFFAVLRQRDSSAFFLVISQSPPELMGARFLTRGIREDDFRIIRVTPEEVPGYLCASDLAISFIRACYSKQSSSPTKIAEYLASGLPIVCNAGVGDIDEVIGGNRVGSVVDDLSIDGYNSALNRLLDLMSDEQLPGRCRQTAVREFDLVTVGGASYRRLYRRLMETIRSEPGFSLASTSEVDPQGKRAIPNSSAAD